MDFKLRESGDVTVIRLNGDMVGGPDATGLSEKLHELLEAGRKKILIDMECVRWMNSSGLGILIGAVTTVRNHGGELKLLRLGPKPGQLLKITRLDRIFEFFDNEELALDSF
ncbi:MAG TPA: anti-sigma factor antagonist [bacterium]|nr:anti-sigma factor antagonist [bacterium]